jgi:predicted TIM-barrel fold metal-dependent hydrolase
MNYQCISADNHLDLIWMPRDTWQHGLPEKLRAAGPKVVETERGSFWEFEGQLRGAAADGSSNAQMLKILRDRGLEAPDGALPPSNPKLLLEYMDQGGMYAAVTFGGLAWKFIEDPELLKGVYAAYNDFALEVARQGQGRIVILPNITARLPEECPGQIEALAKRGVTAVEFPYWDAGAPLFEEVWEPMWSIAEEAGVRICSHLGIIGGPGAVPRRRGANLAWAAAQPLQAGLPLGQLIFSGVFERHPNLRFCFGETRVGWAPFHAEWMDRQIRIGRADDPRQATSDRPRENVQLSMLPSEYLKRNVILTFEDDTFGTKQLETPGSILEDIAVWGGDFPHPQGIWGADLARQLEDMFEGVAEPVRRRVLFEHTAEFFDISVPTPT